MKTTLERLEQTESELKALATLLGALPELQQQLSNANQATAQLQDNLNRLNEHFGSRLGQLFQFAQMLVQRQMGLEQSIGSIGKSLAALVAELESKGLVENANIMTRIRKMDEDAEFRQVAQMLEMKLIAAADTVAEQSLVIVSQKFVDKDGKETVIADYRKLEMPGLAADKQSAELLSKTFLGRSVGDVVEEKIDGPEAESNGTLFSKIEAIYDLVQQASVQGEQAQEEAAATEQTQEQSAQ